MDGALVRSALIGGLVMLVLATAVAFVRTDTKNGDPTSPAGTTEPTQSQAVESGTQGAASDTGSEHSTSASSATLAPTTTIEATETGPPPAANPALGNVEVSDRAATSDEAQSPLGSSTAQGDS